jgi:hypothetical protein
MSMFGMFSVTRRTSRANCAQPLELRAGEVGPKMAGMQHQLELAEALVGEPRDT